MGVLSEETGVILVPPFRGPFQNSQMQLSFEEYDAQILFYLAYFDNIVVVPHNVDSEGGGVQTSTLLEQSLVRRGKIRFGHVPAVDYGDFDEAAVASLTKPIYEQLNDAGNEQYALATPPSMSAAFPASGLNSLVVSLERCLPAPRPDIPADEIIAFRKEFSSELALLRIALTKLCFGLNGGVSVEDARALMEREILLHVGAIQQEFTRAKFPFALPDLKVWCRLGSVAAGATIGTMLAGPLGAVVGAVAGSAIELSIEGSGLARTSNAYPPDFQYVASGFQHAMIKAFPERPLFELNIDKTVGYNTAPLTYPTDLTEPMMWQLGSYEGNTYRTYQG